MIDASHEPYEKNIEICKKVVDYAHKRNCVVEGELGHLVGAQFDEGEEGGKYSTEGHYTNPEQAVDFVKQSGVDSLAIAIGNSHGAYKFKGEQHLDLERREAEQGQDCRYGGARPLRQVNRRGQMGDAVSDVVESESNHDAALCPALKRAGRS